MTRPRTAPTDATPRHPSFTRRFAVQAGAVGLLGLGLDHLAALRAAGSPPGVKDGAARSVIFIFLSGGLAQHDSFDPKPDAPDDIRGEFRPIATRTPGVHVCEHLPLLAARSHLWSMVRSLTHPHNDHSAGHHVMLTGRSDLPPGFSVNQPNPTDWPSIAAVVGAVSGPRGNLPPAVVLPERLVHTTGRVIPGQFAGAMGPRRDPWFVEASPFDPTAYGAFPEYEFDHQDRPRAQGRQQFHVPDLTLPEGLGGGRLAGRLGLLAQLDRQRAGLDASASTGEFDARRRAAVSLLTDAGVRRAFDVSDSDPKLLDAYGRNSFGWSLLMARRLVEAGVALVQVNLGNNETWDTHGNAFPHLKDNLLPPTDRAVSALLDDLDGCGLLDDTLVVMAGEFGRTPRISTLPSAYKLPGRDHWGRVQTVFLAGGGVAGGRVVGSSDRIGGYPASDPQTPEDLAATIYRSLGIPPTTAWQDELGRPHQVYLGTPIGGLV
ncbi:DUF1501 domain-containing protein [Planctomyces sp. SH-PL62]|uniref:DUF1501 domain-containing protein n=1 Tax=Planctomyces sp. SH-PL62 TaxID=1636152 RepID=UPI00078C72E1|nr:DUF1501 domain-containing protein [Planctomyces sp. SH-PL62]AMV36186.1 hypothetical protein VT85_02000 [Planctomyces sp. SH-PL62]